MAAEFPAKGLSVKASTCVMARGIATILDITVSHPFSKYPMYDWPSLGVDGASRLLRCSHSDFHVSSGARQFRYSYCRTSGARLLEICRVDCVHSWEQLHVGEIHLHCDGVLKSHVRFFQHEADVLQALLDFGLEVVGDLARLKILAGLAGDVESPAR